jgi:hypothetical protein
MEKYFQKPSVDVLATLFRAVNSLDLTSMPTFSPSEKAILRSWDLPDLFEEKFIAAAERAQQESNASNEGNNAKHGGYIDLATNNSAKPGSDLSSSLAGTRKDRNFFDASLTYDGISIPIRVSLTNYPEEVGDVCITV